MEQNWNLPEFWRDNSYYELVWNASTKSKSGVAEVGKAGWSKLATPYHFSSTTFFSVWVVDKNNRMLNPLLTSLSPRSFVHRPTTLHVHCLHISYWLAPFRLQNIVYLQLVTFQRIIFFGSFMNLPLLFLFWLCVADAIFVYKPLRDIFSSRGARGLTRNAYLRCSEKLRTNNWRERP